MRNKKWGFCANCSPKRDKFDKGNPARLALKCKEYFDYETNQWVTPDALFVWKCENCGYETPFKKRKKKDSK